MNVLHTGYFLDDSSKLRAIEVKFLTDPANAELFTDKDADVPDVVPKAPKRRKKQTKNSEEDASIEPAKTSTTKQTSQPRRKKKEPELVRNDLHVFPSLSIYTIEQF